MRRQDTKGCLTKWPPKETNDPIHTEQMSSRAPSLYWCESPHPFLHHWTVTLWGHVHSCVKQDVMTDINSCSVHIIISPLFNSCGVNDHIHYCTIALWNHVQADVKGEQDTFIDDIMFCPVCIVVMSTLRSCLVWKIIHITSPSRGTRITLAPGKRTRLV